MRGTGWIRIVAFMLPARFSQLPDSHILEGIRLVGPDGVIENAAVGVEAGRITFAGKAKDAPAGPERIDLGGLSICPGLIDTHVHGAAGHDFMAASGEVYDAICGLHAKGGTTALLLTTVTAPLDDVYNVLRFGREFLERAKPEGARILGAHIEGPFLSPERPGVHDIRLMRHPDSESADALLTVGLPVRLVTLAPELPGAPAFIQRIQERGALASGGHSDAWDDEVRTAFDAGLRRVTHTFNCMSTARKRGAFREAGLLEFALGEPEICCEAIADGAHVPRTLLRMLYRAKGADGITLITDASSGCGLPEGSEFEIAGSMCRVSDGRALTADGQTLAGSTLTMWEAVRGMIALTDAPLHEAVRMASLNPARALGLEHERGCLAIGTRADYLVFDASLNLLATVIEGNIAAQP